MPTSWGGTCSAGTPGTGTSAWQGWWGEDPPYHTPVFVLTHHERAPLPMQGGTTFHFVTDGVESALKQAHAAAGDKPVCIAGGATTVRSYLAAGLVDELVLHVVPVVLGEGERLWDGLGGLAADAGRGDRLPDGDPRPLPLHPPTVSPGFRHGESWFRHGESRFSPR